MRAARDSTDSAMRLSSSVVAVGSDFTEARDRVYQALGEVSLQGGQFRTDIAARVAR